jgi:hypothetical protein
MNRSVRSIVSLLVCLVALRAASAAEGDTPTLRPYAGEGSTPAAPWRVSGLPNQTKPFTRFSVVDLDGHKALKIEAESSYGNLVHPLRIEQPANLHLAWQWRVDQPIEAADISVRASEDIALKVCTMWDEPIDRMPFVDRQSIRFLRSRTDDPVPGATVCYIWDAHLPVGTQIDSPFTRRLRYIVLRSGAERLHRWTPERRDIAADFMKLFGEESRELPPLIGIAVGADADNTRSHSLSHAADLVLAP